MQRLKHTHTLIQILIASLMLSVFSNSYSKVITAQEAINVCQTLDSGTITKDTYDVEGVITGVVRAMHGLKLVNADIICDNGIFYLYRLANIDSLAFEHFYDLRVGDTVVVRTRLENYDSIASSYYGYLISLKKYKNPTPELLAVAHDQKWQMIATDQHKAQQNTLTRIMVIATGILFIILIFWAYSLSKRSEQDYLTKLFNRSGGEAHFNYSINSRIAGYFIILDLDKFKSVNDRYGHDTGDVLLIKFAQTIKKHFPDDITMRMGGDEFAIYIEGIDETTLHKRIDRFFADVVNIKIDSFSELQITSSAGATYYNGSKQDNYDSLYIRADKGLYESKQHKGCCLTLVDQDNEKRSFNFAQWMLIALLSIVPSLGFASASDNLAAQESVINTFEADSICSTLGDREFSEKAYNISGVIIGYRHVLGDSLFLMAELEMGDESLMVYNLADYDSVAFKHDNALGYGDTIVICSRLYRQDNENYASNGYLIANRRYIDPVEKLISENKEAQWMLVIKAEQEKAHTTVNIVLILCAVITITILFVWLINANHTSKHDHLTKVNNRFGGESKIREQLARNTKGYFCLFDIDKFKVINDNLGHTSGDECLAKLAAAAKKQFSGNIVMRLGGDEFAIFIKNIDQKRLEALIEKFFNRVHGIHLKADPNYRVAISMGIARCDGSDCTFDQLYSIADKNLYKSKETRGCNYTL